MESISTKLRVYFVKKKKSHFQFRVCELKLPLTIFLHENLMEKTA